jgi:histone acetyltransferase (RNA polymerase elongator complex component)
MDRHPIIPFFISHAGCPHRCVFCNQATVAPPRPLKEMAREVVRSLEALPSGWQGECAFYGGTFAALPPADRGVLLEAVRPFIQQGKVTAIRVSTRPDSLTGPVVEELARSGVATVEIGAQSLHDGVLQASGRGHDAGSVSGAVALLRHQGLRVGLQLMVGLPGDSAEGCRQTMAAALTLSPDFLRVYPTLVLAGTELANLYRRGAYRPLDLEGAVDICKGLLLMARRGGVPVIRMGVQPTAELDRPGVVLAGPLHPAFRQLVEGALYTDLLLRLCGQDEPCLVRCHPSRVSDVVGQRRSTIRHLAARGVRVLRVEGLVGCAEDELIVEGPGGIRRGSLLHDLPC